jgi:hypothetical protein
MERVSVKFWIRGRKSAWVRGPFPEDRLAEKAAKLIADVSDRHPDEVVDFTKQTTTVTTEHVGSFEQ